MKNTEHHASMKGLANHRCGWSRWHRLFHPFLVAALFGAVDTSGRLLHGPAGPVGLTSAISSPAGGSVTFECATLTYGATNTLEANNVTDRAAPPNRIAANASVVTNAPLPFEPMAPCSRKTGLVISEMMYHPPDAWGTNSLEFVELHNPDLFYEEIGGWRLAGDIDYTFPPGMILPSGGYVVIARDPVALEAFHGITGVLGPYTNNLPNDGGTLRVYNEVGGWVLEVNYQDNAPWPVAADGSGHSLVLRRPSYGEDDPRAWGISDVIGGSPGRGDGWGPEPLRNIVLNEFLANSDPPQLDFLELYNASIQPADLSGAWLSDDFGTHKFQIPPGTVLPPQGVVSFNETQLGFALSSQGDEIVFWNPARTRVIDALRFGAQAANVSRGRSPDGSPWWSECAALTPGSANGAPLRRAMVINEIMYHPLSDNANDEYVELYNRGAASVNLGGWRLNDGIRYTFPANFIIPPGGYVVVAESLTNLLAKYPHLTTANTVGNYSGTLRHSGERIALEMPQATLQTNHLGLVTSNLSYITVNEVTYRDGGRWGKWSDRGGSSLELMDPNSDNRFAANWADSDETGKAPWTTVEFTAAIDNGMALANGTPDRFEILMQDAGECLIDDLEIRSGTGANLITNPGFESGATRYSFVGTHRSSFVEPGVGVGGSAALHVMAVGRGDPGPNKIWTRITGFPTSGTGTIRAKLRWLKGTPFVLLRTRGQWLEAPGLTNVPSNLGTPGLPNSRWLANAGPAIAETTHTPVLPATGQPVVVSARVNDPDGVASVTLRYRVDPNTNYTSVVMADAGTGGDALAGDGLYSATIPGQSLRRLVAFYITSTDAAPSPATTRFPDNAPTGECLVLFGETPFVGAMGTYRFWLTQSNIDTWTARERNSNEPFDATFAYGNSRVIYNTGALYSGSPYHSPGYSGPLGGSCDYELNFPKDDLFLGTTDFVLAAQASTQAFFDNDLTCSAESTCYWLGRKLGLPYNHKRVVRVLLNGRVRAMIYYDHQQPNRELVSEYFPEDDQGDLHKIEDWFEFDDAGSGFDIITCRLGNYVSGGAKKAARYRYNWRPRAVTGSPNNFGPLFQLVDAANAAKPEPLTSATLTQMDVEQWMRVLALQHAVGNWDTYGYNRGKNAFAYKPLRGPWKLLLWDLELVLGKSSDPETASLLACEDPTILALYNHPPFGRAYWRAFLELVQGPMRETVYAPRMLDRYTALVANGVPAEHPSSIWNWINRRRDYIVSQIPSAAFTVSGPNFAQTTNSIISLSGTAPVTAQRVVVNGIAYPILWPTLTAWTLRVPVQSGTNLLVVQALDRNGTEIPGGTKTITVHNALEEISPVGQVVFNEIMYDPTTPGSSFVELYNRSSAAFDLGGWRIDELPFTFAPGTLITNGQYLVVARDRYSYAGAFGGDKVVVGEFARELDHNGETLSLIQTGATPAEDRLIDRARYEPVTPWPAVAAGRGASLQLIDAAQDNARVSNWSDGQGWRKHTAIGLGGATLRFYFKESKGGDLFIDDVSLTDLVTGSNYVVNGDFEAPLSVPWGAIGSATNNTHFTNLVAHSGNSSLRLRCLVGGPAHHLLQNLTGINSSSKYLMTFWYLPADTADTLIAYLSSTFRPEIDVHPEYSTPGSENNVVDSVPPYPTLWLNEVQPMNLSGVTDRAGPRAPWIELHNPGPALVSLADCYLSDSYVNLTQWPFPSDAVIHPGQFLLVWADGQPARSAPGNLHTSFRITNSTGSVALSRSIHGAPQLLDYLNFAAVPADGSYGAVPDGQPFYRFNLPRRTPGAANLGASPPRLVYINEWMAANTSASGFADPADGGYEDWFELYNPGPTPADLAGCYLTDTLTNEFQFCIPAGYVIPPGGFLLVWADNEPGQNDSNRLDLHVNFALRQSGEAIGLFAADGTAIDTVTFGPQTNNVSEGRYPDGPGSRYFMPRFTPRLPNVSPEAPPALHLSGVTLLPGGTFSFSVFVTPGRTYRLEYTDDLNPQRWTPLSQPQIAGSDPITITETIGSRRQRFYRIVVLD